MRIKKIKSTSTVFQAGIGYTIGNILVKGISFMTLPLFSRLLTTEQFGVYNVFVSYEAILFVIVGFAIHSSVRSANIEFKNEINSYVSSVSLIYIINVAVLAFLSLCFQNALTRWMGFSEDIILMLILYSFGSAILTLYNNYISLEYSYKKYLIIGLCNSLGNVLLSLFLIFTVFSEKRDVGRITGATFTMLVIAIVLLISMYRKARPQYCKSYWRFAVKYSLPIIPHGLSQVLLAQCDRIMIRSLVSSAAAGIYSLAGNIQLVLTIITDSISTAWTTWFYEKIEKKEIADIQLRAVQIVTLFTIFAVGAMALSPELVFILGGREYDQSKYVAVPMIVDAFVLFLYNLVSAVEYYTKKTNYIMFGTVAAAVINVVMNYIFIVKFGFVAAAYTTLFSYVCYLALHIVIAYRLMHFHVLKMKYLFGLSAVVGLSAAADLLFVGSIPIRYLLCAFTVAVLSLQLIRMLKKEAH